MDRWGPACLALIATVLIGCVIEAPDDATPMVSSESMTGEPIAGRDTGNDDTPGSVDELVAEVEPSCGNEDDIAPNQTRANAYEAPAGFQRDDLFLCPGTADVFKMRLLQGQALSVGLVADPEDLDFDLILTDEGGDEVDASRNDGGRENLELIIEEPGVYFLFVEAKDASAGFYALGISGSCSLDAQCADSELCDRFEGRCRPQAMTTEDEVDACGADEYEPNNRDDQGPRLEDFPAQLEGRACRSDADWFTVNLAQSASLALLARFPAGEDIDLFVIDADNGATMGSAIADRRTNPERIELSHLPAGTYRVGVSLFIPEGEPDREVEYGLEVAITESAGCNIDRDCRSDELPMCVDGSCQALDPAPMEGRPLGSVCSDDDDCAGEEQICWTGGPGGHDNMCTRRCRENDACSDVNENAYCAGVMRGVALCVPGCETDDQCGIFYSCQANQCEIRGDCRNDSDCAEGELCQPSRYGDRYCSLPLPQANCGADEQFDPNDRTSDASLFPMGETVEGLQICNEDNDWYQAIVSSDQGGQALEVELSFQMGSDMDLYVYDEQGNSVGEATSPDQLIERVRIRFASPGTYLVRVDQFDSMRLIDNDYSLKMTVSDQNESCTVAGNECAATSPLRLQCDVESGGCVALNGEGQISPGDACDSDDDCGEDAGTCWISTQPILSLCTKACRNNGDCALVPGASCQRVGRRQRLCIPSAF